MDTNKFRRMRQTLVDIVRGEVSQSRPKDEIKMVYAADHPGSRFAAIRLSGSHFSLSEYRSPSEEEIQYFNNKGKLPKIGMIVGDLNRGYRLVIEDLCPLPCPNYERDRESRNRLNEWFDALVHNRTYRSLSEIYSAKRIPAIEVEHRPVTSLPPKSEVN